MYSVLNTLSEYTYFYISKDITLYTFLLIFKSVESLHCILMEKAPSNKTPTLSKSMNVDT